MTIGRIIEGRDSVVTCDHTVPVSKAVTILADHRIGAVPVLKDGDIVGIFSERDVIYQLRNLGSDALSVPLSQVMTQAPITVEPETSVLAALALMTRRRIRHLPVVRDGKMVSIVSIGDLVKYRIDKVENEAAAMRDYIQTS